MEGSLPELVRAPWFYRQWMIAGNPAHFFQRLVDRFGDFVHYRGLFRFYLVNHPTLVKQVLMQTHDRFDKNTIIYNRFRNVFGNGLVVSEGQHWKRQRRLMQPMFGPITIRRFFDEMLDSANQLADRLGVAQESGEVVDVAPAMNQVTLEIAGRALFHSAFRSAAEDIHRWTETINRYSAKPPMPISGKVWFPSRTNRRLKQTLREFEGFVAGLIRDRRTARQSESSDLLSILLETRDDESGEPMTHQEITEEVLGMIIGGHETSSSALTWFWYELDRNPEVRSRVENELDQVIGRREMTLDDLPKLKWTKMAIDETMRLHPPFWFENRNAMTDVELAGETIPAGSMIAFSRYSLHRNPRFWREPHRFDPTRFEPGSEENKRSSYAFVPFGGGPRICIGIHFATMELLVIIAALAQRYRLRIASKDRHQMAANLTMEPKYGLKVAVESRSSS